jgi:hypothetical protein
MTDLMIASRSLSAVGGSGTINVAAAAAARRLRAPRISWHAIWIKAVAMAAAEWPELRTGYLRYPWAHLYLHPHSVASVTVERRWNGAPALFVDPILDPAALSLAEIERRRRSLQESPIEKVGGFRRQLRISRLPWIVRRAVWHIGTQWSGWLRSRYLGTYTVTKSHRRIKALQVFLPISFVFYWTAPDRNGDVEVRIFFDHRIIDGSSAARIIAAIERAINEGIAAELAAAP